MINVYKRKNEIGFNDSIGRRKLNKHIETNYIKLEKGYYSIKELFLYTLQRLFGDRVSEMFK